MAQQDHGCSHGVSCWRAESRPVLRLHSILQAPPHPYADPEAILKLKPKQKIPNGPAEARHQVQVGPKQRSWFANPPGRSLVTSQAGRRAWIAPLWGATAASRSQSSLFTPKTSPKFTDKSQRAALPAGVPWETDPQRGAPPLPAMASPTGGAQTEFRRCPNHTSEVPKPYIVAVTPLPATLPLILQQFGQVRHSPGIPQGLVARLGCGRPAASNARGATWAAGRSKNRRYLMGQRPVLLTQFFPGTY